MKTLSLTLLALLAVCSNAQWSAHDIHPAGHTNSTANSTDGSFIYGSVTDNGSTTGGYFDNGTFTSMQPIGSTDCGFSAFSGGSQYGTAIFNGSGHASKWNGTSASYQDWNPSGSSESYLYTAQNGQAGGYATFGGTRHATLWNGAGANDTTDFHQGSWLNSAIDAIDDNDIYGDAEITAGTTHAMRWASGPGSPIDMNPLGGNMSQVIGAHKGRQSGWADFGSGYNAVVWAGTSASAINLNPVGYEQSIAYDIRGTMLAGTVWTNGDSHAGFWNLATNTFTDLNVFAVGFSSSAAYSMEVINGTTYVYGAAWDTHQEVYHAMVWTQSVPEPCSMFALATFLPGIAWLRKKKR